MITFKHFGILSLVAMAACGRSPMQDGGVTLPGARMDAGLPPCEEGLTQCGKRNVSLCYDLRRSPVHCGTCEHACAPGIACQAGACQQVSCSGPLSFKALDVVKTGTTDVGFPYRPVLGDFDGDGILDLAGIPEITDPGGILAGARLFTGISLLYGAGDGTFPTARRIDDKQIHYWKYVSADLDGDRILDLAFIRRDHAAVTVRRGSGNRDLPFGEAVTYPTSQPPYSVLLADLNSDGRPDLVAGVASNLELWRGQGTGRFEPWATLPSRDSPHTLVAVDWNRDGALDLVYGSDSLHLRLGRGDGTFDPEVECGLALPGPAYGDSEGAPLTPFRITADLDHDNLIDMVGRTGVFLGLDGCTPSRIVPIPTWVEQPFATRQMAVELADLNGDGHMDILSSDGFYLGDGKGGFAQHLLPTLGTAALGFFAGDLNRDGKLDVIVLGDQGRQVLLNTCP